MHKLAKKFSALADPNRLKIIQLLAKKPGCVCQLESKLGISQNLLSHHLRVLREAELVQFCRCGKEHHYSLNHKVLTKLVTHISKLNKTHV